MLLIGRENAKVKRRMFEDKKKRREKKKTDNDRRPRSQYASRYTEFLNNGEEHDRVVQPMEGGRVLWRRGIGTPPQKPWMVRKEKKTNEFRRKNR